MEHTEREEPKGFLGRLEQAGATDTVDKKAYRTSDLYFAAFLKTAGVPLLPETDRDGRRIFFLFEWMDSIAELRAQYFNRAAKVSALSFVDEIRSLKSLTHLKLEDR